MQIRTSLPSYPPPLRAASAQPPAPEPVDLTDHSLAQRVGRIAVGVVGAAAGVAVGVLAGALVGGAVGGVIGYLGHDPMELDIMQPLHSVCGLAGKPAHAKVAGKLGERAGQIAGALVGAVTGTFIGALGMAVSAGDSGYRLAVRSFDGVAGEPPPRPIDGSKPTYEQGWGQQIPTPDGKIHQDQHHWYYNLGMLEVLDRDAASDPFMAGVRDFLKSDPAIMTRFQMGGWNMDTFLGQVLPHVSPATFHHFAEAFMPSFKDADWQCRQAYDKAADLWKAGERQEAMYYLGASVHLAQDVAFPQHAAAQVGFVGKMLGHQMMERWTETQFARLKPAGGGTYLDAKTPEEFCQRVAEEAREDYPEAVRDAFRYTEHRMRKEDAGLPTDHASQTDFQSEVYQRAVQRAVNITPGFLRMFFEDMQRQGYPI